jgi:hypothetical protein
MIPDDARWNHKPLVRWFNKKCCLNITETENLKCATSL